MMMHLSDGYSVYSLVMVMNSTSYRSKRRIQSIMKQNTPLVELSTEDSELKRADISCGDASCLCSSSLLGLWKNRVL